MDAFNVIQQTKSILWCQESCITPAQDMLKVLLTEKLAMDEVNTKIQSTIDLVKVVKAAVTEPNSVLYNEIVECSSKINIAHNISMGSYGIRIHCLPDSSDGNHFKRIQRDKKKRP